MANRHEPVDEQEKELLAAARNYFSESPDIIAGKTPYAQMLAAIAAYDPPKPKKYTMPEWPGVFASMPNAREEYGGAAYYITNKDGITIVSRESYNAIREATGE